MGNDAPPPQADDTQEPTAGRFAYDGIDRLLHERARLSILASLVSHVDGLAFNDLKHLCSLTDGNLSRHAAMLDEAGLIEITKGVRGNRPLTRCRLTEDGRQRFLNYIQVLQHVVEDAKAASPSEPPSAAQRWSPA
ncbi:MAG: transcriptional regulator [Pirellulaceae bacterium]|jgi:DNA-binding transcriptional ArsR family regulator|nr:transcriptional regulator [Pirellulaceae bacterium]MDP7019226.1 transcriptional regulator [Pirellulaceae bacterium]